MKLRNKKTGEILEFNGGFVLEGSDDKDSFHSIKDVINSWEDYTPQEPLIKDEKIRKAVRAWADVIKTDEVYYKGQGYSGRYCWFRYDDYEIDFPEKLDDLSDRLYTIAELCGEKE